jgi:hypothetical protein
MMECRACGNKEAYHVRTIYDEGQLWDSCNKCSQIGAGQSNPDVYWPGHEYKSENLCDTNGNPILLRSRQHKAQVMKELGVSEAGDRIHGAPYTPSEGWIKDTRDYRRKQFDKERPKLRQIYKDWRSRQS